MRRPKPDRRPSWRDPTIPIIRNYRMADGSQKTEVDEGYERRYREFLMQTSAHPGWRDDPTYNLRRKK